MAALPPLSGFRSALIVKPSSLGDIVHTLPAVHLIKQAHPHLHIRWIANPEWLPLIQGAPCVDEVIEFPRKQFRGLAAPFRYASWAREFKRRPKQAPEVVLDFQGLFRSAFIGRASGSRPIVGLSDSREGARYFCDHVVPTNPSAHAVDRYLSIPEAFGIAVNRDDLHWPLPPGEPVTGFNIPHDFVLVHPWSRGEGKSLPPAVLNALLEELAPRMVVLVGRHDSPPSALPAHVCDFANQTTLAQLIWLMRRASWNISVDSGPMHIAAAVNDRTLGIHTWSDPRKVGPYNPKALVWKAGRIATRRELTETECRSNMTVTEAAVGDMVRAVIDG